MNQMKTRKHSLNHKTEFYDRLTLIGSVLVVGLMPMIVHSRIQMFIMPVIDPVLNLTTGQIVDYFTYYKSLVLTLIALFLFFLLVGRVFLSKLELKSTPLNVPLLIFVLALCLSLFFSSYKTVALWGGETRNFGTVTYFSCMALFFLLVNSKVNAEWEKIIVFALYPVTILNALMAILFFYGINIWNSTLFTVLAADQTGRFLAQSGVFTGTLGHGNYLSGLGGMLFAIFSSKAVFISGKGFKDPGRILSIAAAVLSAVIVFVSKALSGIVTIAFIIPILIGLILESRRKDGLHFLVILLLTVLSYAIMTFYNDSFYQELTSNMGMLIVSAGFGFVLFAMYLSLKFRKKVTKRRIVQITTVIIVLILAVSIAVIPKAAESLTAELERTNTDLIRQRLEQDPFDFPEAKFGWGTGRVYIWQKTLQLVAHKPLFGYGLDTLPFEFDQGDPAKIAGIASSTTIVDKPHNIYINLLYGAGSIAFLAYLAIVVMVIWKALKALSSESEYRSSIWPLLLGILAYLYQGLFNDPVHGVEPIFWVLMGVTYALADKAVTSKSEELSKEI